jgi:hypothetical protein
MTFDDGAAQRVGVLVLAVDPDVRAPDSLLLATTLRNASRERQSEKGDY